MSDPLVALRAAHRRGYAIGLALCLGTPGLIAVLLLTGLLPPGPEKPEGPIQQVGYLFTGLVFLSGAWVWARRGRLLRGFGQVPVDQRPALVLRESLLCAALFETSALCGLVYWLLVGEQSTRHVWGFLVLTPLLFLALAPRLDQWLKGLEA